MKKVSIVLDYSIVGFYYSQRPPTLSMARNGKTTDNVLRLALKGGSLFIRLTDIVGSLKVWGLRPHAPSLTLSVVLSH